MSFKKSAKHYWPLLLILLVSCFLFLGRLNKDLLWDWDECLYAVNVREMRSTGHFLSNIWNGYLDFQKPPGYSWLLQAPISFGINEFTIRILSVLAGLGIITAVYIFSRKYFSQVVAILASLMLLASELIVIYSTKANTDIFFTLFIFLGFWAWIKASYKLQVTNYKYAFLAGLFFGLSVMVKGIGSIQFLIAIFLSIFLNFRKEKLINFLKLSAVFLLTVIPWHALVYAKYGNEFFRIYILENIIKRSRYPIEFHRERWWFYFLLLERELRPWIYFAFIFPIITLFSFFKNQSASWRTKIKNELKENELIYTVLLLIIIPLISLVRFKTKIAWYAMPIYPFLAMYLAYNIELLATKLRLQKFLIIVTLFLILDSGRLMINENRFMKPVEKISPRNEIIIKARNYPQNDLNYLVPFGERQARDILPPEEQIPQTWIFGGHPCAVYYSGKKVNYYYFIPEFQKKLEEKGLFLIENGDLHLIENLSVKILFKNSDFTLFENL